jgi:predicted O-methyltransferase YrrM
VASGIYMPISEPGGRLLYSLVRAARPGLVVEFGTSYGISTLFLAAAVRDNGTGRVVTTELSAEKAAAARRTFAATGLDDVIILLEGDALEPLAALDEPAGFVLLDGWKELCLPVLRLLEPRLAPGTLVVADDVDMEELAPYLEYVRDPANGYRSLTFPYDEGMEISCRLRHRELRFSTGAHPGEQGHRRRKAQLALQ